MDEHELFDEELSRLAASLRGHDYMLACLQLAEFALRLDHYIRREERALAMAYERLVPRWPNPLAMIRTEHAQLRRLVASIAAALDRADSRRGVEVVSKLRSVLLIHVAKEEALFAAASHQRSSSSSSA